MNTRHLIKVNLILCILLLVACQGYAQAGYEDVVYLKNGGIMRGMIIEQVPNQSLKIQTVGRNVFVYSFDEIAKITKEEIKPEQPVVEPMEMEKPRKARRTTFIVEGNAGLMVDSHDANSLRYGGSESFGLMMALDVNLTPKMCLGLGGGADMIAGSLFYPIFLDYRYSFSDNKATPILSMSAGWSIGHDYKDATSGAKLNSDGGIYISPSFGIRWNASESGAMVFSIGPRLQGNNGRFSAGGYSFRYSELLPLVNLRIGAFF